MLRRLTEPRRRTLRMFVFVPVISALCFTINSNSQIRSHAGLATAKAQLGRGDLQSSEQTLWDVLSSDPNNQQALVMLGTIRLRQQRFAEAESLFRRVLQLNPKSAAASRQLGLSLMDQGKEDEAIQQYKKTIALDPQDSALKIDVARLQVSRKDFAAALTTLRTVEPDLPKSTIPLKAACLLGLGRKAEAEVLIRAGKRSQSSALDLAQVFVQGNDPDAALNLLRSVNAVGKMNAARLNYIQGRAYREKNELGAAAKSFRQSLADNPNSGEALMAMAEVFSAQGQHQESFETIQKARAADPDSAEILRHLIVQAMESGHNDVASSAAQELQSKSSESSDRYLVAGVLLQQKQYLPASHILEEYVDQRPDDAKAFLGLGIAYIGLLRYADAQRTLERSLQLDPNNAEAEYRLGTSFAQQGDQPGAISHWEKAVALQPRHASALFDLGAMYLEAGQYEKARDAFTRSLAANPNNMKTEYDLALVLNKLGDSAGAKLHLDRYRKMQSQEHTLSGNAPARADRP